MFNDNLTMKIGCKLYGFKVENEAFEACDIWAMGYLPGQNEAFEEEMNREGIEWEIISNNC